MLAKAKRLTHAQFDQYFKLARRYQGRYLTILFVPQRIFQAAVVVGKKVDRQAVGRNRWRRRLYTLVAEWHSCYPDRPGVLIILAKPNLKTLTQRQYRSVLQAEIEAGLLIR